LEWALRRGETGINNDSNQIKRVLTELQDQQKDCHNDVLRGLKDYRTIQQSLMSA
jgi:hypothetical protein